MDFKSKYKLNFNKKQNFLCVGLDPDMDRIPENYHKNENPIKNFCLDIIEKTHQLAVAYKPNLAFFESSGLKGYMALEETCQAVLESGALLIIDAKRGDIGNTASHYAKAVFEGLKGDAVTLSPYMGWDSIEPFADYKEKASFILGLTSNPSAHDFETLDMANGKKLYETVLETIKKWQAANPFLGAVIGATQESELVKLKEAVKEMPLLVPGVGAQGGSLEAVVKNLHQDNMLLINSSRGIIYADDPKKAAEKIAGEMKKLL